MTRMMMRFVIKVMIRVRTMRKRWMVMKVGEDGDGEDEDGE